jgi:hypothetical protein
MASSYGSPVQPQQQQHDAYGMHSGGSYSQQQQQQQQQAFMPMGGGQQQQYGGGGGYGAPAYQMPYQPQQPGGPGGPAGAPGASLLSGLSPLGLMTAGGLLSAPQQYVQQRMGWFAASVSGGTMSALFNVTPRYVAQKLLVLCLPFLGRWSYSRAHEQVLLFGGRVVFVFFVDTCYVCALPLPATTPQMKGDRYAPYHPFTQHDNNNNNNKPTKSRQVAGGNKYRPPAADPAAPDLFVPLMAAWTYAFTNACVLALRGAFRPDVMGNLVRHLWWLLGVVVWSNQCSQHQQTPPTPRLPKTTQNQTKGVRHDAGVGRALGRRVGAAARDGRRRRRAVVRACRLHGLRLRPGGGGRPRAAAGRCVRWGRVRD